MRSAIVATMLVGMLAYPAVSVGASGLPELARLRATYTNELAKIERSHEEAVQTWREQYLVSLRGLEKFYKDAGQLEPLLDVQKEIRRFVQEKTLEDAGVASIYPELLRTQKAYLAAAKAVPVERARKVLRLSEMYDRNLQTLQENLTRQGDVDGALTVKNTRDQAQRRPDGEAVAGGEAAVVGLSTSTVQAVAEEVKPAIPGPQEGGIPQAGGGGLLESRISARFDELCGMVRRQDFESAVALVEPAYVSEQGAKATRMRLRYVFSYLIVKESDGRLQSTITVSAADRRAALVPWMMSGTVKKEYPPMSWVFVDNEWYVSLKGTGTSSTAGDR